MFLYQHIYECVIAIHCTSIVLLVIKMQYFFPSGLVSDLEYMGVRLQVISCFLFKITHQQLKNMHSVLLITTWVMTTLIIIVYVKYSASVDPNEPVLVAGKAC